MDAHTRDNPLAPGMPREAAARRLGLPDPRLVDALAAQPELVVDGGGVHRPGAIPQFPPAVQRALDEVTARLRADPFAAPEAPDLARLGLTDRHLGAAARAGVLLRLGDGVHLLPGALEEAAERLSRLPQPFTLSEARQALGTTRRVAVPLLEALDAAGRTRRLDPSRREVVR